MAKKGPAIFSPLDHPQRTVHTKNGVRYAILEAVQLGHVRINLAAGMIEPQRMCTNPVFPQHLSAQIDTDHIPSGRSEWNEASSRSASEIDRYSLLAIRTMWLRRNDGCNDLLV
jgi:hypothetical protein